MTKMISEILNNTINPITQKTFKEENRIIEINEAEDKLTVHYNRDGIDTATKKLIEAEMIKSLADSYTPFQIYLMSFSNSKKTPEESAPSNNGQEASLNVGHGPMGPAKKRVPHVKKVLAVSSCKGGVGKSTITLNVAMALKEAGFKVGIIDADIYGPSMPRLLGKREAKPQGRDKVILPVEAHGLKFISFGLFINEKDPVIWRGPMLGGVLNQFFFDVDWGELDYLLIDLPPGTGDTQLSMVQLAEVDGVVVVSTPQKVALTDSIKGLRMFEQLKIPVIGLIENMSYFYASDTQKEYDLFGKDGVRLASEELGQEFLGQIPLEVELRESSDEGTPYFDQKAWKDRPARKAFKHVASQIVGLTGLKPTKGLMGRLFGQS